MDLLPLIIGLKEYLNLNLNHCVREVILFGSRSTRTATEYSDYDILIVLAEDYDWRFKNMVLSLVYNYELENEVFFDIHFLSLQEIEHSPRSRQPIFINALEKGVYA